MYWENIFSVLFDAVFLAENIKYYYIYGKISQKQKNQKRPEVRGGSHGLKNFWTGSIVFSEQKESYYYDTYL